MERSGNVQFPIKSRQRPPYLLRSIALERTWLVGFLCRDLPAGSVSLPSRCPQLTPSISVLVTFNTQYLSSQRLSFLFLGAQLILEKTKAYCWKLVFLG